METCSRLRHLTAVPAQPSPTSHGLYCTGAVIQNLTNQSHHQRQSPILRSDCSQICQTCNQTDICSRGNPEPASSLLVAQKNMVEPALQSLRPISGGLQAIRTHGTLNFYSKKNISSWSARFSTLSYNTPRSYSP
jgi:hypothetical protein